MTNCIHGHDEYTAFRRCPKCHPAQLKVEVVKYKGRNGDRATVDTVMYCARVTGANGDQRCVCDWMAEGGYSNHSYAVGSAKPWAAMFGVEIEDVEHKGPRTW